jgi:hypothetical protein
MPGLGSSEPQPELKFLEEGRLAGFPQRKNQVQGLGHPFSWTGGKILLFLQMWTYVQEI